LILTQEIIKERFPKLYLSKGVVWHLNRNGSFFQSVLILRDMKD
jgi:hypothetical protein